MNSNKEKVARYYDQNTDDYIRMYQSGYTEYPANLIRLNIIVRRLLECNVKKVLDVGFYEIKNYVDKFMQKGLIEKRYKDN